MPATVEDAARAVHREVARGAARPRILYLASPGHSGSTLLAMLLGRHSAVATIGEVKVAPICYRHRDPCSCGAPLPDCDFWKRVESRLERERLSLADPWFITHAMDAPAFADRLYAGQVRGRFSESVRSGLLGVLPSARRHALQVRRCNRALMTAVLELQAGQVLLDTSKDASRLRCLLETGAYDIRVLHLIRDGRAVANSLIKKGVSPSSAAEEWLSEHHQAERLRQRVPAEDWLSVRYEELCAAPQEHLERILTHAFGPLPVDASACGPDREMHILGNRMRLGPLREIKSDEAWRSELRGDALQAVERRTRELNTRYGYR